MALLELLSCTTNGILTRVQFSLAFVCLSDCLSDYFHDISKTDAARITKLGTQMFHDESWKPVTFVVKRSKVTSHKNIAGMCLHSLECWLLLHFTCVNHDLVKSFYLFQYSAHTHTHTFRTETVGLLQHAFWCRRGRSGTVGGRSPRCFFWVLPKRTIPKPDQHRKDNIQQESYISR